MDNHNQSDILKATLITHGQRVNLNKYMSAEVETPGKKSKLENVIVESEEANPTLPTSSWICVSYHISTDEWTHKTIRPH